MSMPAMPTATEARPSIGVLLAGGLSSRMGCDKALLDWRGRPLIERQLDVLRASGVDEVRVSGDRPGHPGIADREPRRGPLGGLAGVAATIAGEAELLAIPVDMPRLSAALLRRLCAGQAQARALRFAGHVLPLRLRLDDASRALLAALLREPEPPARSLRALQHALDCVEIALDADEAAQLLDCNTPASWSEAAR